MSDNITCDDTVTNITLPEKKVNQVKEINPVQAPKDEIRENNDQPGKKNKLLPVKKECSLHLRVMKTSLMGFILNRVFPKDLSPELMEALKIFANHFRNCKVSFILRNVYY